MIFFLRDNLDDLSIFQVLGVLIMSIGLKGTMKALYNFPPIIITSIFSIWTIGPPDSCSTCCNSKQKLGVSFTITWMNLLLTFVCLQAYLFLFFNDVSVFNLILGPFYVSAIIYLILLQCLDKCWSSGCWSPCRNCCDTYCYPVIELTYLDVNNMDSIVTQDNIELDQI